MGKARATSDDPFKGYRVKGKFKLRDFDPEATPFARGDEAAQRTRLDALATEVATGAPGPLIADPRRPIPGTKLVREWQGEEQVVTVLTDGFEWQGRRFKSLSAAVRAITGSHWNGWKFFGLAHGADSRP